MNVTFRPYGPLRDTTPPRRSTFKAGWSATMTLLQRELNYLDASAVVIQIDVTEGDIRIDGWPRANARPGHAAAAISFDSKYGPLRYDTARFDDWQDNVRAIALGLEALRKVDRYGITRTGEQYRGWRQLEAPGGNPSTAERLLVAYLTEDQQGMYSTADANTRREYLRRAYRIAVLRHHPDHGGTVDDFETVVRAARTLGVA